MTDNDLDLQNLGLGAYFVRVSKHSKDERQKNYYKTHGTYLENILATKMMFNVHNYESTQVNMHLHKRSSLIILSKYDAQWARMASKCAKINLH